MNETTEKLVRELAEKLGTTTEHLWGVLLKQAPISAASDTIIMLIMLAILWGGYRLVREKTKVPPKTEENRYPDAEWECEEAFAAWGVLGLYAIITLIVTCCTISSVVTATMNPEYWALKQLLP